MECCGSTQLWTVTRRPRVQSGVKPPHSTGCSGLGRIGQLFGEVLEKIFDTCGRRLADEVDLLRVDPMYRLIFEGGGSLRAASDLDRMAEEIARRVAESGAGVEAIRVRVRKPEVPLKGSVLSAATVEIRGRREVHR